MKGYTGNLAQEALENEDFRRVLYTDERIQLVVMCLNPNEDIGEEVHQLDQCIRVEEGEGKSTIDGAEYPLTDGSVVIVPAGTMHNILNTSRDETMKLSTLYAPPHHAAGLIHKTKEEAQHTKV